LTERMLPTAGRGLRDDAWARFALPTLRTDH
jgi:hypothetical protein